MENIKAKQEKWGQVKEQISKEIGDFYEVSVRGIDTESNYFHPFIKISDVEIIVAQCDLGNDHYYALKLQPGFDYDSNYYSIELQVRSFKEAITLIEKTKIRTSVRNTLNEIKAIESGIQYMRELITAKLELLNSTCKRF